MLPIIIVVLLVLLLYIHVSKQVNDYRAVLQPCAANRTDTPSGFSKCLGFSTYVVVRTRALRVTCSAFISLFSFFILLHYFFAVGAAAVMCTGNCFAPGILLGRLHRLFQQKCQETCM